MSIAPPTAPPPATWGPWSAASLAFAAGWTVPAFADGTPGNVFPPQYRVNLVDGTVEWRGAIEKGAAATTHIFDLPPPPTDVASPPTDVVFAGVAGTTANPKGEAASLAIVTSPTPDRLVINHPAIAAMSDGDLVFLDGCFYSAVAL